MPPPTCLQLLEPWKQNILPCSSCRRFLHNAPEEPSPWPWNCFPQLNACHRQYFSATLFPVSLGDATAYTSHPCKNPYNTVYSKAIWAHPQRYIKLWRRLFHLLHHVTSRPPRFGSKGAPLPGHPMWEPAGPVPRAAAQQGCLSHPPQNSSKTHKLLRTV